MLKTLDEYKKPNWKDHIKKLVFAYNNSVNKTTGYTPFYLLFGRKGKLPIDLMFPDVSEESAKAGSYDEFVKRWQE